MNKESRRWKWSACSYRVYGVSEVERNSRDETVERAPLQDRSQSGRRCDLNIGIDGSPDRRDYAQHPDRRCEQDSTEDCYFTKPQQPWFSADPASEMIKCPEPHQVVRSIKLRHQILQINADFRQTLNAQRPTAYAERLSLIAVDVFYP